MENPVKLAT